MDRCAPSDDRFRSASGRPRGGPDGERRPLRRISRAAMIGYT